MAWSKSKAGAVVLAVGFVLAAAGRYVVPAPEVADEAAPGGARPIRTDPYGDPLPPGALARLGTLRFRHDGDATTLAFSPDGKILAGWAASEILLWDAATGRELRRMPVPSLGLTWISCRVFDFAPDGKTLAVVEALGGVTFRDVATGRLLRSFKLPDGIHADEGGGLCYSPDGRLVALVDDDQVDLFDVATGRIRHQFGPHRDYVYGLAFSPDSKFLALGTLNPALQLWDVATGKLARAIHDPNGSFVQSVAFTPDGKILAAGSGNRIRLVDVASGKEVAQLAASRGAVVGLAFTPDGKTLVSADQYGKVRVWDWASKQVRLTLDGRNRIGRCLALSKDGRTVALGTAGTAIRLWKLATGEELFTQYDGHDGHVNAVAFAPDGKTLASGSDNQIRLWDTAGWKPIRQIRAAAQHLAFAPDGTWLASVGFGYDKTVRLWDPATGRAGRPITIPDTNRVLGLAAVDGPRLVTLDRKWVGKNRATGTTYLSVWDAATGRRLHRFGVPRVYPSRLLVTPDGRTAVVGEHKSARLYDLDSGAERTLLGGQDYGGLLALAPDGRTLLVRRPDDSLSLWETATSKEILRLAGDDQDVLALAFALDGRLAASANSRPGADHPVTHPWQIRLWDTAGGKEIAHFQDYRSGVTSLAFSADVTRLVSGHQDGTVLVWDLAAVRSAPLAARHELSAHELEDLWTALAGADAGKAYQAIWALTAAPAQAVPWLRDRLRPVVAVHAARLRQLLAELDSNQFAARQAAAQGLEAIGEQTVLALRRLLAAKPPLEVQQRVSALLRKLEGPVTSPEVARGLRAVAVLEHLGTPPARRVLRTLAEGAPAARLTREAQAALRRLALRPANLPLSR